VHVAKIAHAFLNDFIHIPQKSAHIVFTSTVRVFTNYVRVSNPDAYADFFTSALPLVSDLGTGLFEIFPFDGFGEPKKVDYRLKDEAGLVGIDQLAVMGE